MRGIHRWPVNSPHKGPNTWKMSPFDDVIMIPGHGTQGQGGFVRTLGWVRFPSQIGRGLEYHVPVLRTDLNWFYNIHFRIFNSSVGWIRPLGFQDYHSAFCRCPLSPEWGCSSDNGRIRQPVSTVNRTNELLGITHVTPFRKCGKRSTGPSTYGLWVRTCSKLFSCKSALAVCS